MTATEEEQPVMFAHLLMQSCTWNESVSLPHVRVLKSSASWGCMFEVWTKHMLASVGPLTNTSRIGGMYYKRVG